MSAEQVAMLERQLEQARQSLNGGGAMAIPAFKGLTMPPATPPVTPGANNLQAVVQAEVRRQLAEMPAPQAAPPGPGAVEQAMMVLLSQSIKPEEMQWVQGHIKEGAPGFVQFMQSDTVKTITQMAFEAYKEFLAGQRK